MSGEVLPFRRRSVDPAAPKPEPDRRVHRAVRGAEPKARDLAAGQAAAARDRYDAARARQNTERLVRDGTPVPARITLALDSGGHEGPQVDVQVGTWEGNPAGDVDAWEAGQAAPSAEQVRALVKLTGFPVAWFYEPLAPGWLFGQSLVWMCGRSGCEAVESGWVDERGVLHRPTERGADLAAQPGLFRTDPLEGGAAALPQGAGETRPAAARPARKPPKPHQGTQLALPAGRLDDAARAELEATLARARAKYHGSRDQMGGAPPDPAKPSPSE